MSLPKAIIKAVTKGTAKWAKQRKAEERHESAVQNRRYVMMRTRRITIKEAATRVMREAYMAASSNGRLPANARQIMYQARPKIQGMTDKPLNDQYFTQVLLPDYIEENGVDWNVVFDDRGHFAEPHTGKEIGLGTIAVRNYIASIDEPTWTDTDITAGQMVTHGPECRYGAALFVEKEGFAELFESVELAGRFDIAIMSTKGMSVTAARELVDELSENKIPIFVLHDLDKAGFSILGTLRRDTRRYSFSGSPNVIDLGLRLADIGDLESEDVFDKGSVEVRRRNLRQNGATPEEVEFLLQRRVELNALPSDQLIQFIERKLQTHGVRKIIPDPETLAKAYRLWVRSAEIKNVIKEMVEKETDGIAIPADLNEHVAARLREHPAESWDEAVRAIAADDGYGAAS
jgi:hypothetical protein